MEEIKEYEKRLAKRLDNGKSKDNGLKRAVEIYNQAEDVGYYDEIANATYSERPPFPLLDMYAKIVWPLSRILEQKTDLFVFSVVSELGNKAHSRDEQPQEIWINNFSLECILKDKRFIELVSALKKDFDMGYEQFSARPNLCGL